MPTVREIAEQLQAVETVNRALLFDDRYRCARGSLRIGKNKTNSIPTSDAFKAKLIEDFDTANKPKEKLDNVELDL